MSMGVSPWFFAAWQAFLPCLIMTLLNIFFAPSGFWLLRVRPLTLEGCILKK
jgi:hypothetical protein